jgi:hypothetical protein
MLLLVACSGPSGPQINPLEPVDYLTLSQDEWVAMFADDSSMVEIINAAFDPEIRKSCTPQDNPVPYAEFSLLFLVSRISAAYQAISTGCIQDPDLCFGCFAYVNNDEVRVRWITSCNADPNPGWRELLVTQYSHSTLSPWAFSPIGYSNNTDVWVQEFSMNLHYTEDGTIPEPHQNPMKAKVFSARMNEFVDAIWYRGACGDGFGARIVWNGLPAYTYAEYINFEDSVHQEGEESPATVIRYICPGVHAPTYAVNAPYEPPCYGLCP